MLPRDRASLIDILAAAESALSFTEGIDQGTFLSDEMRYESVIRKLEILGEASRRLSPEARASLPDVPWHGWIALRNRLIHTYDAIDLRVVWKTVREELPVLVQYIEELLGR